MDRFELCIVGAGIVGLAIAEHFSHQPAFSGSIVLLEQHRSFGQETSSRNSEVIHAGLYYPPSSLKARLCREGASLLYEFCTRYGVSHQRTGKIIVAQEEETPALEALLQNARHSGVEELRELSTAEMKQLEPLLHGARGLLSPATGIVDSHGLMSALLQRATENQVVYAPLTRLESVVPLAGGFELRCVSGSQAQETRLQCARLINAAGLEAGTIAAGIEGFPDVLIPQLRLLKGNYFRLGSGRPFTHLVYPVPGSARLGLGIHATLDLNGNVRFGPDVEEISVPDYRVNPERREMFVRAIRRYYPSLDAGNLVPDYAGIRPRLLTQDGGAADFMIQGSEVHGMPGLVQLFGIESPGLTASLALARMLAGLNDLQSG